jgi:hypothetical protein
VARKHIAIVTSLSLLTLSQVVPSRAAVQPPTAAEFTATLQSQSVGDRAFEILTLRATNQRTGGQDHIVPTHPPGRYCYYSEWRLIRVNAVSRERKYGVYIYNACDGDRQIFPVSTQIRMSCNNDDNLYASGKFSICPLLPPGHVPAGLPPLQGCNAEAVASQSLLADLQPSTYDPSKGADLTVTTSFASDFADRLADGTCLANIDWQDRAWTMRWSDGAADQKAGTGRQGTTDTHTIAADPAAGSQTRTSDITAIAHLSVSGQAVDFDADGNPIVITRSANIDISNKTAATGQGSTTVGYALPQLVVAGVGVIQHGDGSVPAPSSGAAPQTHVDAIRGRLLVVYPQALVVVPGTESVGGVVVGDAVTTTLSWTYLGPPTDAPLGEASATGSKGLAGVPVTIQWNHAEPISTFGTPTDELVPLQLTARSVYPDGHIETQTITGAIAATIFYVGLGFRG